MTVKTATEEGEALPAPFKELSSSPHLVAQENSSAASTADPDPGGNPTLVHTSVRGLTTVKLPVGEEELKSLQTRSIHASRKSVVIRAENERPKQVTKRPNTSRVSRRVFHVVCFTSRVSRRVFHVACFTSCVSRRVFHVACFTLCVACPYDYPGWRCAPIFWLMMIIIALRAHSRDHAATLPIKSLTTQHACLFPTPHPNSSLQSTLGRAPPGRACQYFSRRRGGCAVWAGTVRMCTSCTIVGLSICCRHTPCRSRWSTPSR